jgi:diguanylate cyclase (GGDEF)-like protein
MIFSEAFSEFVNLLASEENTLKISQQAFSIFSDEYHIGRINLHFKVGSTAFTPGGDDSSMLLYQADGYVDSEPGIVKEYHTGENGILKIMVSHILKNGKWTEEEKNQLCTLLDVTYFHLGRFRLLNQAIKNSFTDFMTKLPNTDGYMRYVNEIFAKHELSKYSAYYFNLKGFGLVNRKFGKKETDNIIIRYTKILKKFTNGDEIVGRLGGDNFVALIRKERTRDFLKLLAGAETYGYVEDEKVPLTVKAVTGILEIDDSLENCDQVLSKSGMALNIAKNIVKKPYVFATSELDSKVYKQKQIAARFPAALTNEEFLVYYQPKVETDGYTIIGAEALVRWYSEGHVVSPGDFIPVIEQDNSVCRLDFYMLEHVCQDICRWMAEGITPVRVSVNFSRKHLTNPDLAEDIVNIINRYGVPASYIEIEITETTNEEEQDMLNIFTRKMRESRIATAIDDFGTGYSSLNMLRSFPIDVLKIDKSFIDKGRNDGNDSIVLTNIIKMAKELDMDVITEGVENWNQVEFLRNMECNVVQGFLFDKPMPEAEFREKIRHKSYDITKLADVS